MTRPYRHEADDDEDDLRIDDFSPVLKKRKVCHSTGDLEKQSFAKKADKTAESRDGNLLVVVIVKSSVNKQAGS